MKKHQFAPGHVVSLEDRALLSGGFKFPTDLGGNDTLGFRGALVLTSRKYEDIQSQLNTAIQNFNRMVVNLYDREGGFTQAFDDKVGVGSYGTGGKDWAYGRGTLLAHLDAKIASLESMLPYGAGRGANNPTGGAGLSNRTALTSTNPALADDGDQSVAQLLEAAVTNSTTKQELESNLEQVRIQTLALGRSTTSTSTPTGLLPSYIAAFGPAGSHDFGLRNS